jgi:hypothetical protein
MEYLIYILPSESSAADPWTIGTAIASAVIAFTAVIFSWMQSRKTDRHNRLMVTPHISSLALVNNEENSMVLYLENNGIGPAIIKDFSIHVDGSLVSGDDEVELSLAMLLMDLPITNWGHESLSRNSFLPAGKKIELATVVSEDLTPDEIIQLLDPRYRLQITYHSIYGDQHTFDSDNQ